MAELQADPEYLARIKERDRKLEEGWARNRADEAPVVRELVAAGFPVKGIWDLISIGHIFDGHIAWPHGRYTAAIPVLLRWLPRVENRRVKDAIVRALTVPWAAPDSFQALLSEFRREKQDDGVLWAIGNALGVIGDETIVGDLMELAADKSFGTGRQMIVHGLGKFRDPRLVPILIDLLADDDVAGHAVYALGKLKAEEARPHLESLAEHPKAWTRGEVRKALAKLDRQRKRKSN